VATPTQFLVGISGGITGKATWQVNGIAGGDDTVEGLIRWQVYRAHQGSSPATVNVAAVSYEDQKLSVTSKATIVNPPPLTISPTCTPTPCMLTSEARIRRHLWQL